MTKQKKRNGVAGVKSYELLSSHRLLADELDELPYIGHDEMR